jgi:hypothetical protein
LPNENVLESLIKTPLVLFRPIFHQVETVDPEYHAVVTGVVPDLITTVYKLQMEKNKRKISRQRESLIKRLNNAKVNSAIFVVTTCLNVVEPG